MKVKTKAIKTLIHNKEEINKIAAENIIENENFREFLNNLNSDLVDEYVFELNKNISVLIDCTKCGACCNKLMINIEPSDIPRISSHLKINDDDFIDKYVERGTTMMIMNSIPCTFLSKKMCTVYEGRFTECREFPNLHKPGFQKRLFATLMHYEICPIIFNVIENLKIITEFKTPELKAEI